MLACFDKQTAVHSSNRSKAIPEEQVCVTLILVTAPKLALCPQVVHCLLQGSKQVQNRSVVEELSLIHI